MQTIQFVEALPELPQAECVVLLTNHAHVRARTRGIREDHIQLCLAYAEPRHFRGALVYMLRSADLPSNDQHAKSAVGTTVVEAADGSIITVYRRRRQERLGKPRVQDSFHGDNWAA